MTVPVALDYRAANEGLVSISQQFAIRFQQEMERIAQVAFDAAPDLKPEEGWRYDVFAHTYVQLALPVEDAPILEPASEATE